MIVDKGPFSPLSAIGFEILLSLAEGKRHGYHVMLDIAERTQGRRRARLEAERLADQVTAARTRRFPSKRTPNNEAGQTE